MNVIELKNVTKEYNTFRALDGINLEVKQGTIFGYIGPNGAGKTTTIKLMLGMIKPTSGEVRVFGCDVSRGDREFLREIGYVPETDQLYGYMTMKELIEFSRGFYGKWNDGLVNKYLEQFNLPLNLRISNFSKGMKVKAALLLAIAHEPKLLVLDEPTSGMDPIFRREFLSVIMEEITLQGRTVFFSSHIIDDVERVADVIGIINRGKLIKNKSIDDFKKNEKKIRVVFQKEVPEGFFDEKGIVDVEKVGKGYIITVSENLEGIYEKCRAYPHFALEVIHQNLEDVLIDIAGRENNDE